MLILSSPQKGYLPYEKKMGGGGGGWGKASESRMHKWLSKPLYMFLLLALLFLHKKISRLGYGWLIYQGFILGEGWTFSLLEIVSSPLTHFMEAFL